MKFFVRVIVIILSLVLAAGNMASPDFIDTPQPPAFPLPPPPPMVFEHLAVNNILQEQLAQLTGRSIVEIKTLMTQFRPQQLAQELAIDKATLNLQMNLARQTFLRNALIAGLITDDQWQQLSEMPSISIESMELNHRTREQ